jgi:hypothetical chaperone protein
MSNFSCGIDFGTTNSAISLYNEEIKLVKIENNQETIPTTIFFPSKENEQPLFGRNALNKYIDGENGRFMRSLKRILGTDLMNNTTTINRTQISFDDIIGKFISHIKTQAEKQINNSIKNVVIGRPVHFCDGNISKDTDAVNSLTQIAKNVGFENINFQFEPIAAAFAHEQNLTQEKLAFVIDIGGGTSDFTVIKIGNKLKDKTDRSDDILSNHGIRIGGNDLDKDLAINSFMPEFGLGSYYKNSLNRKLPIPKQYYFGISEWSKINSMYNLKNIRDITSLYNQSNEKHKLERLIEIYEEETAHRLLNIVETSKIELTDNDLINKNIPFLSGNPSFEISKRAFENSIEANSNKIKSVALETIKNANIKCEDIELIILTGGSTEIPYIQNRFISLFPNAKISNNEKLSSVGLGLGYDAMRKFG